MSGDKCCAIKDSEGGERERTILGEAGAGESWSQGWEPGPSASRTRAFPTGPMPLLTLGDGFRHRVKKRELSSICLLSPELVIQCVGVVTSRS